jgi:ATP-binding cassette, subfamily B, bacterial MsbA
VSATALESAPAKKQMDVPSDLKASREVLARIVFDYGASNKLAYAMCGFFLAVSALTNVGIGYIIKPMLNGVISPDAFGRMLWLAIGTTILFLARGGATFGALYVSTRLGNRVVASVQKRVFDHLLEQDLNYFQDRHSSEFVARLALAANGVRDCLQLLVQGAARDVLQVAGLVTVMIVVDPRLSAIALLGLPIAAIFVGRILRRVRRYAKRSFDGSTLIMQAMSEAVQGMRIVKAFNLQDQMRQRMSAAVRSVEKSGNGVAIGSGWASLVADTLAGLAIGFAIYYGSYRVSQGADPGSFISFFGSLMLAYEPAKRLGRFPVDIQNGAVNAALVYEVLDAPLAEPVRPGLRKLNVSHGEVDFLGVSFGYRPRELVINRLTMTAESQTTTALVGPSGGGKSTILGLIQRFYAPQTGVVSIDGVDVAGVDLADLRNHIAFVSQDVFLFRGTIRDNIALGKPGADFAAIVDAAKGAYAHDFILEFPLGYDTPVGEMGAQLSGGQRQRIAIARAILKDAPILLLDEPTAALDSESERAVQTALQALRGGRTTIVVAHRLQTIVGADKIIVIDGGKAVEAGTHRDLIAHEGAYKRFFAAQFGAQALAIQPKTSDQPDAA